MGKDGLRNVRFKLPSYSDLLDSCGDGTHKHDKRCNRGSHTVGLQRTHQRFAFKIMMLTEERKES